MQLVSQIMPWLRAPAIAFFAERDRWALWAPVLIGCGVAAYFTLPVEPPIWVGPLMLIAAIAGVVTRLRSQVFVLLAFAISLIFLGFAVAQLKGHFVSAPVLERDYGPASVSGRVIGIELFPKGARVLLDRVALRRISAEQTPERIRIRLRAGDTPEIGSRISIYAKLMPPGGPAAPGAYDFQRQAWFAKLGAVGFAFGTSRLLEKEPAGWKDQIALWITDVRQRVASRIRIAAPGQGGAVAAALVTGDRSGISKETLSAMRDSGLAHLLAISGLHMGLVAAILFFGLRTLLALSERLALFYPIKKWAAAAALVGGFAYLLLTGGTIPTQRAFLMTGLVLVAVLLDRTAISMRLVAWAAAGILLIAPESLLSASFQMSFAAVVALVAVYEDRGRLFGTSGAGGPVRRAGVYVGGVALTTIVAGAATGIFAMYHFGRIAHFGVAANLLAVPITAFWIMPWAVIAMVIMPFGLESLALTPMAWGIDGVIGIARFVANWPGAVGFTPAMPTVGLVAAAIGGLWLCLWRQRWRYIGMAGVAAGIVSTMMVVTPDIMVSGDGRLMAVRNQEGELVLSSAKREKRTAKTWAERAGQDGATAWRAGYDEIKCDGLACSYRSGNRTIALINDARALQEDCRRASIVVSAVPVRFHCPSAQLLIDRFDLWRKGPHAIWLEQDSLIVRTVAGTQGKRLWTPQRQARSRKKPNTGAKVRSAFLAP